MGGENFNFCKKSLINNINQEFKTIKNSEDNIQIYRNAIKTNLQKFYY